MKKKMTLEEGMARLEQIHKEMAQRSEEKVSIKVPKISELITKVNPNQSFLYKKMSEKYKFGFSKKPIAEKKETPPPVIKDWSKVFIGDKHDSIEDDVPF